MGAGSWGTTFAQVLCDAGTPTVLWARRAEVAKAINDSRENSFYLPGIALTDVLRATADEAEALDGVDLVVLAVPAQSLRENLAGWAPLLPPGWHSVTGSAPPNPVPPRHRLKRLPTRRRSAKPRPRRRWTACRRC